MSLLVGCNQESPTEPTSEVRAAVSGHITHAVTQAPLANVEIVMGDTRARTDASGRYSVTLSGGEREVFVDGEPVGVLRANATRSYEANYAALPGTCLRYYGLVTDASNGRTIAGATIRFAGTTTTDAHGSYVLYPPCGDRGSGTAFMTASAPGYTEARVSFRLENLPPTRRFDFALAR